MEDYIVKISRTQKCGVLVAGGGVGGVSAAMAVTEKVSAPRVDVKKLQKILIDNGVYLD